MRGGRGGEVEGGAGHPGGQAAAGGAAARQDPGAGGEGEGGDPDPAGRPPDLPPGTVQLNTVQSGRKITVEHRKYICTVQGERARLQALLLNKDRTIARLARENRWDNLLPAHWQTFSLIV